ncbi:MAG: FkbM family methyltransferase [Alphaproteobacteria bacterium]|nr:FkbM family methyltransferase [Alphaproteobacteria bacterium]
MRCEIDNNYDWGRFSYDGIDRSQEPYTELHIATLKALIRETESFFRAWCLLADETSKDLFVGLLRYRLAGHRHVRLPVNTPAYWAERKKVAAMPSSPSALSIPGVFGNKLFHYEFVFENTPIKLDANGLYWPFFIRQYFLERDGIRIRPERGDHVIDGGACLGDTAIAFGAAAGSEGSVYLFDMLDAHVKACAFNITQNPGLSSFKIFPCGLSDIVFSPETPSPASGRYEPGFSLSPENRDYPTTTLDHLVKQGEIPRVDFIKMDIEGSELKALHGASETLHRFKPKLAISIYHDIEHFYAVPLFIDSLGLGYRFYLGHYSIHAGETVLYAVTG